METNKYHDHEMIRSADQASDSRTIKGLKTKTYSNKNISKSQFGGESSKMCESQVFGDLSKKNIEDIDKLQDAYGEEKSGDVMYEDYNSETYSNKVQIRLVDIVKRLRLRVTARKLINSTRSRMLKNMTSLQYEFINDKVQNFQDLKSGNGRIGYFRASKNMIFMKIIQIIVQLYQMIPIINPSSKLKSFWDFFIALILLDSFFIIPVMVSFGLDENSGSQSYCVEVFLVLNVADIFVQTNTGFYRHGVICNNRQTIWKKYCDEQARIDLFSLIPLLFYLIIYELSNTEGFQFYQFITLSILIKLNRITKIYNNIQQNYILEPNKRNILSLLELFLKILAIAHICACFWIFAGRISEFVSNKSWMQEFKLEYDSWQRQYLTAFYFCIVTMSTVGYGDIFPQTPIEICFCIVMVLFACGVFGFSVNTINTILQDFFKDEKEIMEKMFIIKNYLQKKSINQNLQRDVTEYLEYIWRSNKFSNPKEEEKMIKILPDYLRNELLIESNKIILRDCPILQNNFSEELIRAIIPLIKERNYTPDEMIYAEGDDDQEKCIYFMQEGVVHKFINLQETISVEKRLSINLQSNKNPNLQVIKKLKQGEYFGEVEFFTGQSNQANVKSAGFSTILTINREQFLKIIRKFPKDYEQFCLIKDKITLNEDYSKIFISCSSCKSEKHNLFDCPYLHFIPNVPKIIALSNRSSYQERNANTEGKLVFRNKTRYNISQAQQAQMISLFQEMNEYSIDEYQFRYLSFSVSKCDICNQFTETENNGQIGIQQIQQNNNKEASASLVSINTPNIQIQQYNNLVYSSNCNSKKSISQQLIPINTPQITEDQVQPKIKSCLKNLMRKFDTPESIPESSVLGDSPSNKKGSPYFKKKSLKRGDQENLFHSQMSQGQGSQHQIGISNNINLGSYAEQDDSEKLQQPSLNCINSNSISQNINLARMDSQNKPPRNRSNIHFYDQQLQSHTTAGINPTTTAFVQGTTQNQLGQTNVQNKRQHPQLLLFDLFFGQFESMKNFSIYHPLYNYEIVIQQIHMNSEQKKRLKNKLMEQSRQQQSLLKRRTKLKKGTQYSTKSQAMLRNSDKDPKASVLSKNLIIASNVLNSPSLCFSKVSPLKKQKKGKKQEMFEDVDLQSTFTHNRKGSKKESTLVQFDNNCDQGMSLDISHLNQLISVAPSTKHNENDQSKYLEFGNKFNNSIKQKFHDFPAKISKTQKSIYDEDISNNSPTEKEKNIQNSHISKPKLKNYFSSNFQEDCKLD